MSTHHPIKEQASSHATKDGKEYLKYHIPGQKSNAANHQPGNPTKGKDLEEGQRDGRETN